jgi:hypothetical protein
MLMKRKPLVPPPRPRGPDPAAAEALAVDALHFLSESPERLRAFLDASGLRPDTIREAARDPGFLAGVLDHVVADEALLLAFAAETRRRPEQVMAARRVLSPVEE